MTTTGSRFPQAAMGYAGRTCTATGDPADRAAVVGPLIGLGVGERHFDGAPNDLVKVRGTVEIGCRAT